MDAIGLKEGMTIADIGAGRGRLTVFFSFRVGETGRVSPMISIRMPLSILKTGAE